MSKSTFNALASLAILAAAPMAAQATMTEMAETEMADVNGQGPIAFGLTIAGEIAGALVDPFTNDASSDSFQQISFVDTNNNGVLDAGESATYALVPGSSDAGFIPNVIGGAVSDSVGNAVGGAVGTAGSIFTLPFRIFGQTVGQVLSVPVDAAGAVTETALLPFTGPIGGLLSFNGRILDNFGTAGEDTADTVSNILFSPLYFVLNPVNRYVDGVNGRFEATVDGAAYAVTEVKGALISNAFAGASQAAGQNGLTFTSRVFGRIAQAQSGLTTQRLDSLAGKYGY